MLQAPHAEWASRAKTVAANQSAWLNWISTGDERNLLIQGMEYARSSPIHSETPLKLMLMLMLMGVERKRSMAAEEA